ncbi:MAG: hypothetical protein VX910_09230 [Candidatus Latescibacterota bacterium]|nr:hypothetical protein [Candidatus Latescibacterota bacterium]
MSERDSDDYLHSLRPNAATDSYVVGRFKDIDQKMDDIDLILDGDNGLYARRNGHAPRELGVKDKSKLRLSLSIDKRLEAQEFSFVRKTVFGILVDRVNS